MSVLSASIGSKFSEIKTDIAFAKEFLNSRLNIIDVTADNIYESLQVSFDLDNNTISFEKPKKLEQIPIMFHAIATYYDVYIGSHIRDGWINGYVIQDQNGIPQFKKPRILLNQSIASTQIDFFLDGKLEDDEQFHNNNNFRKNPNLYNRIEKSGLKPDDNFRSNYRGFNEGTDYIVMTDDARSLIDLLDIYSEYCLKKMSMLIAIVSNPLGNVDISPYRKSFYEGDLSVLEEKVKEISLSKPAMNIMNYWYPKADISTKSLKIKQKDLDKDFFAPQNITQKDEFMTFVKKHIIALYHYLYKDEQLSPGNYLDFYPYQDIKPGEPEYERIYYHVFFQNLIEEISEMSSWVDDNMMIILFSYVNYAGLYHPQLRNYFEPNYYRKSLLARLNKISLDANRHEKKNKSTVHNHCRTYLGSRGEKYEFLKQDIMELFDGISYLTIPLFIKWFKKKQYAHFQNKIRPLNLIGSFNEDITILFDYKKSNLRKILLRTIKQDEMPCDMIGIDSIYTLPNFQDQYMSYFQNFEYIPENIRREFGLNPRESFVKLYKTHLFQLAKLLDQK